jgi:crotonobetainyl-CoA:carnitine CoA-transferase CaiB-like acyl-CoA transferase
VPMIRNPITFSRTPPRYRLPPPALGQDSDQVRAWLRDPSLAAWTDHDPEGSTTKSADDNTN